jgi:DNA-binding transcriptional ArsR family regulator
VLREAGLVNSRGLAQKRLYRVDQTALDEIDRWLEKTREFWSARLDALDHHLKGGSR